MTHQIIKLLIVTVYIALVGCSENEADIDGKKRYEQDGVSFDFPGNWKITDDVEEGGYRYLFVETPGDAIVKIKIYSNDQSFSLSEFVELDIESLKSEMPYLFKLDEKSEIVKIQKTIGNKTLDGYKFQFNLSVLGINVPHVQEYYMFKSDSESAYILNQVAVEDLDKVEAGFSQILGSFKNR